MFDKIFNSPTQSLLTTALDVSVLRNQVIANNIANQNTPGFKRSEVIFEEKVKQALHNQAPPLRLRITNNRHIQVGEAAEGESLTPEVRQLKNLSYRNDHNNVDIDVENTKMAKNKIFYDAASASLTQEIRLLRMAITGRG